MTFLPLPRVRLAIAAAALIVAAALCLATTSPTAHAASAGSPVRARIVGGSKPSDDTYRTMLRPLVGLISMQARDQYDGQFCGGTLIAPTVVLTAGHCVVENQPRSYRLAPSSIGVLVGSRTLDPKSLGRARLVPVVDVFVHPAFRLLTFRSDIALLRLSRPVTDVPTMPLLTDAESGMLGLGSREVGALAAGWGDTDPTAERCCFPTELQSLDQTIHTTSACTRNLDRSSSWPFRAEAQLCSGAVGRDTCQGDSGGPLVVDVAGEPRHAGIVSYGSGCGEGSYGIYTRTSAYRDWIGSLPGTTAGDVRDISHGFDDSTAPTLVEAVPIDHSHVRVTVAPGTGGAPIRYAAFERTGRAAAAEDRVLGSSTTTSIVVQLRPTRSTSPYVVLVRGVTATGETPALAVRTQPVRDLTPPTAPRGVTARAAGANVSVTWQASSDRNGGEIGTYDVQRLTSGRWAPAASTSRTAARIATGSSAHGLVRVRARDAAGNISGWSTASY